MRVTGVTGRRWPPRWPLPRASPLGADDRFHHALRDRGGETATGDVLAAGRAVLDDHGDGDRRTGVRLRVRDEPGVRLLAVVDAVLGGTGLAADGDVRDLGVGAGAVVDDRLHHRMELRRVL